MKSEKLIVNNTKFAETANFEGGKNE